jgi:hypothetical protein
MFNQSLRDCFPLLNKNTKDKVVISQRCLCRWKYTLSRSIRR